MNKDKKHIGYTINIELNSLNSKYFHKQILVKTNVKTNSVISHLIQDLSEANFNIIICLVDKVSQNVPK